MVKWPQKCRVDWDATDGRNGGAQCTVWEVLMEVQRISGKAKAENQGAVALVHSSESAFLWSGLGRRISDSQGRSCGCCAAAESTRGVCNSKDVRQSRSQPSLLSYQDPSGAACFYVLCWEDALAE